MIENAEPIIKWAMEIADSLPERYQEAAFAELLRHALKSTQSSAGESPPPAEVKLPPHLSESWQKKLVSELPEDYRIAESGSRVQQTMWAVIKLWEQKEEANPESVRSIIETRLGIAPESRSNTSNRLKKLTPKYVKREEREEGKGYAYTPTAIALKVFEGLEE